MRLPGKAHGGRAQGPRALRQTPTFKVSALLKEIEEEYPDS